MKILSITTQKPSSTGSGVYLTELVKGFAKMGHEQAMIAGVYTDDQIELPEHVAYYPVYYKSRELPFPIVGMSDEMPYESTRYSEMTKEMTEELKNAFRRKIEMALEEFQPDIILCHHLYFLTAFVREICPNHRVYGLCHGSDLRQIKKNPWQREYIRTQIRKLDGVLALHEEQEAEIREYFSCKEEQMLILGTGYNSAVFHRKTTEQNEIQNRGGEPLRLVFAGKISEKKGVLSLLKSMTCLVNTQKKIQLQIAGGHGDTEEYKKIAELAETCPCEVRFLGRLSQAELAEVFRQGDVFVLPSFYEGLPLVLIEALACGMRAVCTDLPGLQEWMNKSLPGNEVVFVKPPRMENEDEPVKEELPEFEQRLAEAIMKAEGHAPVKEQEIQKLSWDGVCDRLIEFWNRQHG